MYGLVIPKNCSENAQSDIVVQVRMAGLKITAEDEHDFGVADFHDILRVTFSEREWLESHDLLTEVAKRMNNGVDRGAMLLPILHMENPAHPQEFDHHPVAALLVRACERFVEYDSHQYVTKVNSVDTFLVNIPLEYQNVHWKEMVADRRLCSVTSQQHEDSILADAALRMAVLRKHEYPDRWIHDLNWKGCRLSKGGEGDWYRDADVIAIPHGRSQVYKQFLVAYSKEQLQQLVLDKLLAEIKSTAEHIREGRYRTADVLNMLGRYVIDDEDVLNAMTLMFETDETTAQKMSADMFMYQHKLSVALHNGGRDAAIKYAKLTDFDELAFRSGPSGEVHEFGTDYSTECFAVYLNDCTLWY